MNLDNPHDLIPIPKLTQCSSCGTLLYFRIFASMEDCALIFHTPGGCAVPYLALDKKSRQKGYSSRSVLCSNLNESDMIMGGEKKLKQAIHEAIQRFSPQCIFITAGCSSGITGWDIQEFINGYQKEIPIPLVTLVCELEKPKRWGSGFDGRRYDFLKKTLHHDQTKSNHVNIIDFSGDESIKNLLKRIDMPWNFINGFGSFANWKRMGQAKISLCLSPDPVSRMIARKLEKDYQVPCFFPNLPYGFKGTEKCLRDISNKLNLQETFLSFIRREKSTWLTELQKARSILNGKNCLLLVNTNDFKEKGMMEMLRELGMNLVGDGKQYEPIPGLFPSKNQHSSSELYGKQGIKPARAGNHVLTNLMTELNPDLILVQDNGPALWGRRWGIPVLSIADHGWQGFSGLIHLAKKMAQICKNESYFHYASKREILYSNWWQKQCILKEVEHV